MVMQEPVSWGASYRTAADFLRQHYARVFSWCLQISGNDLCEAEDLIQDAFLLLASTSVSTEDLRNVDGYIYTVLRNLHRSRYERARRHVPLPIVDYDCARLGLSVTDSSGLVIVADQLRGICQFACERKETSKGGSVLILRFFHGYYPAEIAAVLLSSRQSVEEYLRTIRKEACDFLAGAVKPTLTDLKTFGAVYKTAATRTPVTETTESLLDELRERIFQSCSSDCPGASALARWYRPEAISPLPLKLVAHIASCPVCLDEVGRLLKLLPLETRNPSDSAGKQSGSGFSVFSRRPKRKRGSVSDARKRLERLAGDLFEHHPDSLCIAVNGQPIATQPVVGPRSEITLRLQQSTGIEFVEVFSEQDVRLLMIPIRKLPPKGPFEQSAATRLSGGREITATFQYTSPWPSIHVVYRAEAAPYRADALRRIESRALDGSRKGARSLWRVAWRPVWRWSSVTISLGAIFFYLMGQNRYNTAEARSLVTECAAWEDAVRLARLSVVRQRFDFRERARPGRHDTVEVWRGAGQHGRLARHLDSSGHLLGISRGSPLAAPRQSDGLWEFDPSAETFAAFTSSQEHLRLRDRGQASNIEAAQITLRMDNQTHRPIGAILRFEGREFEFVETDFDFLPANESPLAAVVLRHLEPHPSEPAPPGNVVPILPAKAELEMAELQARVVLFTLRAEIEGGIRFEQNADSVMVDILVQTHNSQDKVAAALQQIPLIRPRFQVLEDFAINGGTEVGSNPLPQPARYPPLMEPYLRGQLASADAVRDLMAAAAGAADDLLHGAFALSELSLRYPSAKIAALSPEARLELLRLAESRLAELEIDRKNFQATVVELIRPVAAAREKPDTWEDETDWTASAATLLRTTNALHEICSSLFVETTQPPAGPLPELAGRMLVLEQRFLVASESLRRNLTAHIAQ